MHIQDVKGYTIDELLFANKLILYIAEFFYAFSLYFAKTSILCFYWRVFGVSASMKLAIKILLGCALIWIIIRVSCGDGGVLLVLPLRVLTSIRRHSSAFSTVSPSRPTGTPPPAVSAPSRTQNSSLAASSSTSSWTLPSFCCPSSPSSTCPCPPGRESPSRSSSCSASCKCFSPDIHTQLSVLESTADSSGRNQHLLRRRHDHHRVDQIRRWLDRPHVEH